MIELLISLSVLSLLLMVAVPSLNTMMMNGALSSGVDELLNSLNYARNTALSQAVTVQVCPYGVAGSTTCGTSWNNGWIVVTQPSSGTPTLLASKEFSESGAQLSVSTTSIVFDTHGLATTQSNITLCDNRGSQYAHSLEVLSTGFVQAGNVAGQAVWNNSALVCP